MAAYTTIADTTDDQDSPITVSLARAWKNNPIAIAENDQTGDTPPIIVPAALQSVGFQAKYASSSWSEDFDLGGNFNTSTGVFTVGTGYAGLWKFDAVVHYQSLATTSSSFTVTTSLRKNSTAVQTSDFNVALSSGTFSTSNRKIALPLSYVMILSVSDTVDISNLEDSTEFNGVLLSRGTLT